MADKLLAARGRGRVGVNWLSTFFKRTDSFTTRFSRAYDKQKTLCQTISPQMPPQACSTAEEPPMAITAVKTQRV
jgi:hypothetical protein